MRREFVSRTMQGLLFILAWGFLAGCRSTCDSCEAPAASEGESAVSAVAESAPPNDDVAPLEPREIDVDALREELLRRHALDQEVRSRPPTSEEVNEAGVLRVDAENTEWLKGILDEVGWPTKSLVGEEASFGAFLIVQHADHDVDFQARCLPILGELAEQGEVRKLSVAYLTDRVRRARDEPQLYGTQYSVTQDQPGGPIRYLVPIVEDPDRLDERRAAMGLGPWIEYERSMAELQEREPVDKPRSAADVTPPADTNNSR